MKNPTTVLLITLLTAASYSTLALSWEDSSKDKNNRYNSYDRDNTPKSRTLSGDTYRRSTDESDSNYKSSNDNSRRSNGSYKSGSQINDNGLIINKD